MLVRTLVAGRRKPLLADFSIEPPSIDNGGSEDITLRDLIEKVVFEQVRMYNKRQQDKRFDRVLGLDEIRDGLQRGKLDPASKTTIHTADSDEAVAVALLAFEDGLYKVIIDEIERVSLDEVVRVSPDSRMTFIRLVFLAGG